MDFPNFAPLELISPLKYQTYVFTTDWWYKITHCFWEHLFRECLTNFFSVRNTVQKTKLTRVWSPSKSLLFDRLTWLNSSDRPCVKLPFIPSPSNTWYDVPFMLLSTSTFIPSVVFYIVDRQNPLQESEESHIRVFSRIHISFQIAEMREYLIPPNIAFWR